MHAGTRPATEDEFMWGAFARQIAAYAITRRGKKLFALIGVLLLCFVTALLIDVQFYTSAAFTAVLAGFSGVAFGMQRARLKRAEREYLQRKAEEARQRAIAAQARLDRIDTAKSAVGNAAGAATRAAAESVVAVANEAVLVLVETAEAVSGAGRRIAGAVETVAHAGVIVLARGWRTVAQR
jgi:hypothetical protein